MSLAVLPRVSHLRAFTLILELWHVLERIMGFGWHNIGLPSRSLEALDRRYKLHRLSILGLARSQNPEREIS